MQRERAAAPLLARRDDVAAFSGQHPDRRLVHVAEEDLLHAAGDQPDARALLTGRGSQLGRSRSRTGASGASAIRFRTRSGSSASRLGQRRSHRTAGSGSDSRRSRAG